MLSLGSGNIYVKRWNGTSWVQMGGILDVDPNEYAFDSSLALDSSGNPVVSWDECITYNSSFGRCESANVYVKRWDGSNWVQLGGELDINPARNAEISQPGSGQFWQSSGQLE